MGYDQTTSRQLCRMSMILPLNWSIQMLGQSLHPMFSQVLNGHDSGTEKKWSYRATIHFFGLFSPMFQGISPQYDRKDGTLTYPLVN